MSDLLSAEEASIISTHRSSSHSSHWARRSWPFKQHDCSMQKTPWCSSCKIATNWPLKEAKNHIQGKTTQHKLQLAEKNPTFWASKASSKCGPITLHLRQNSGRIIIPTTKIHFSSFIFKKQQRKKSGPMGTWTPDLLSASQAFIPTELPAH